MYCEKFKTNDVVFYVGNVNVKSLRQCWHKILYNFGGIGNSISTQTKSNRNGGSQNTQ